MIVGNGQWGVVEWYGVPGGAPIMNTECDKRIGTYLLESRTNKERDGLAFCGWLDPQCGPLHMSHLRLEVCGGHLVGLDFRAHHFRN